MVDAERAMHRQWERAAPRPGLRLCLLFFLTAVCAGGIALAGALAVQGAQERALQAARVRVDRGLATVTRLLYDERQRRLGDQAELLAQRPAVLEAFAARDPQAMNDQLTLARNQFGTTTAAALVDQNGHAVAEQPPRQPYDYSQMSTVRAALDPRQNPIQPRRLGVEARPTPANPLNELGLAAVSPIVVDGKPVGAVVLLRAFNDGLMDDLARTTGLDVAVLRSDTLLAGSRDVRDLFSPPHVRPAGQVLAPVSPIHHIGDQTYVAAGDSIRAAMSLNGLAPPMATPRGGLPGAERPLPAVNAQGTPMGAQGAPIVATLFVGLKEQDALDGLQRLRLALLALLAAATAVCLGATLATARWLERPLHQAALALLAIADGHHAGRVRPGAFQETASLAAALNTMNAATTARLRSLRDELRQLEAVIDSVNEGIVVLDDRGRLLTINDTAQRLLGLPGGLPPGTELAAVLTTGQWNALRPAVLRRDRVSTEISLDEPRQAIVRVAAVPVHDDFARPLGRAVVLQDVTEERLLDNVKADFFTAMSHELRTPLSAINGAAELLLDDTLSPTQQHFLQTIHRNAERLSRLVTDLLDLGKLESGRVELRLARADLDEIARDVVAALEPVAEREGQRLRIHTTEGSLSLVADPGRVEQIVTNLVSNALQYTPSGGEVMVTTWREGHEVCLAVSDNGVGISTVDLQHLFDKFYQGVNALTHKRGGSGLGLTITKHLTELHGGRIAVQSKLGAGSTFTVRLPESPMAAPALLTPDAVTATLPAANAPFLPPGESPGESPGEPPEAPPDEAPHAVPSRKTA